MPSHPAFRLDAMQSFGALAKATGQSKRGLREWLAEEIGIDLRHCILADMDETECATVKAICDEAMAEIEQPRPKRKSRRNAA